MAIRRATPRGSTGHVVIGMYEAGRQAGRAAWMLWEQATIRELLRLDAHRQHHNQHHWLRPTESNANYCEQFKFPSHWHWHLHRIWPLPDQALRG